MSIRVGVAGASGRMGRAIIGVIDATEGAVVASAWEHPESPTVGEPVGADNTPVLASIEEVNATLDVVIDFTSPRATLQHAEWCARQHVALVIGTTGFTVEQQLRLDELATSTALVQAPNMSVGVNVMLEVVMQAAKMLGEHYDLEIIESHHRRKVDAPSGTALRLLDALQSVRQDADGVFERHGNIGARAAKEIGVQTLRGGDVVGEHTVFYFGDGERLEITHRATDRAIFAQGAVRAALWAVSRPHGKYGMSDVLTD